MGRVQTIVHGKLTKDPVQVPDIIDILQDLDSILDLVPFQDFHNLMVLIIQYPAYLGIWQCPIDSKVLEGPWGNAQQFPDLIGLEPLFVVPSVFLL